MRSTCWDCDRKESERVSESVSLSVEKRKQQGSVPRRWGEERRVDSPLTCSLMVVVVLERLVRVERDVALASALADHLLGGGGRDIP